MTPARDLDHLFWRLCGLWGPWGLQGSGRVFFHTRHLWDNIEKSGLGSGESGASLLKAIIPEAPDIHSYRFSTDGWLFQFFNHRWCRCSWFVWIHETLKLVWTDETVNLIFIPESPFFALVPSNTPAWSFLRYLKHTRPPRNKTKTKRSTSRSNPDQQNRNKF